MRQDIDEPRHTIAGPVQYFDGIMGEQARATITGDTQTMHQVVLDVILTEVAEATGESDALMQLADARISELDVQLRLAKQHHPQQLAGLGLEIAQQAQ